MKRFALFAVLTLSALALGACASVPGGVPTVSPTQVSDTITKVKQITATTCGFVPTAETIGRIAATFFGVGPFVDIASSVADGICNAVASAPKLGRRGRAAPPVYRAKDGTQIVIKGRHV
jgi:hypothetical protein